MWAMHNDNVVLSSNLNLMRADWLSLYLRIHVTVLMHMLAAAVCLTELVDAAFDYERAESDPRVV
eukprot:COSAG06_NODE_2868_length_6151_cov_6.454891_2_plen_65_part_00